MLTNITNCQWLLFGTCLLVCILLMKPIEIVNAQSLILSYDECTEEACEAAEARRKKLLCCHLYTKCCAYVALNVTCPLGGNDANYCDPFGPLCSNNFQCPLGTICCANTLPSGPKTKCCWPKSPISTDEPAAAPAY